MNKLHKSNFNTIVFIYIFIVVIVPVLFIGIANYGLFNNYTYGLSLNNNKFIADDIALRIDSLIEISTNELINMAFIHSKTEDFEILKYSFIKFQEKHRFIDTVLYYNLDSHLIYSFPEKPQFYNFDFSYKQYLIHSKETKSPVWSEIHISEFNNIPSINYTIPIQKNNEIIGFITTIINLEKLLENSTQLNSKSINRLMIITDNKNTILTHPVKENSKKMKHLIIEDYFNNTGYINGTKYIIQEEVIKKTNWKIYIIQSYVDTFASLIYQRIFLILIFFISLLLALFSVYLGYTKIFIPIRKITLFTTRVSRGKYDIPDNKFQIREIRLLHENFLRMLKKITEREFLLKESERKYRNLVEENIDSIFKMDKNLKINYVSPSIENLLGYTQNEFIQLVNNLKGPNTLLPDRRNNIIALKNIRETFIKEKVQEAFTLKIMHKDGYYLYIEIQSVPIKNNNGIVYEIQATTRNITRRYLAERKAEYFKNYLFNIIDSMPSVILTFNQQNKIDQFNNTSLSFFDKTNKELKNKEIWELSSHFEDYKKYFEMVRSTEIPLDFNDMVVTNNKTTNCKVTIFPLKSSKDLLVLRIDDVTKITTTERQLRQAQKFRSIGNMAEGLAHDFNNLLGALSGTINLFDYKITNKLTNTISEDVEILKEISVKGKSIIKQLSSISKPTNSILSPCDLNYILYSIINELDNTLTKKIKFNYHPHKSTAFTFADLENIKEMFLNILNNSINSLKENGEINISIQLIEDEQSSIYQTTKESYWQISISDTAFYITTEDIDNIFDPYYKNKLTGKKQGIALSVAYNIAKSHNGFIDCYADKEIGTTYTIYLPILQSNEDNQELLVKKESKLYKGSGTILIVDDENVIRYTSRKMLEICGYTVIEAKNGSEAINIYREKSKEISIILLDFFMPDLNGQQVYEELIKINPKVKVILTSGAKNNTKIDETIKSGANKFLLKPYTLEELSEEIYNNLL